MWSDSESECEVSELEFSSESDEFDLFAQTTRKKTGVVDNRLREEDVEFLAFHRVSRRNYRRLVHIFKKSAYFSFQINGSNGKLDATDQLSAFLRFAGHDSSSFRDICSSFEISLSSLHRIIHRFTYCFSNMSSSVLNWMSVGETGASERYFSRKGFPGVIGVLGYGHVQIDRPFTGSESYINNDGRYSIQIQIVCNHKCRIIDVFVGYPGGAQPVEVFDASSFSKCIEEKCISGIYRILASNDYRGTPYLVTPYQGELNESQLRFNQLHHDCLFLIHKCFALLFLKFRQLAHIKLKNLGVVSNFVRACCVLHNLTLGDKLTSEDEQSLITKAELLRRCSPTLQPVVVRDNT